MSGLEDELKQKGEQELREKIDSELGGDQQEGGQAGNQPGGDPQTQDQNAGNDPQSPAGS